MRSHAGRPSRRISTLACPAFLTGLASLFIFASGAIETCQAQDDTQTVTPIYKREPYDEVTLEVDGTGNRGTFRVRPLAFPDRQPPQELPKSGALQVDVWHNGEWHKAEIAWRKIAKVQVFEQLVIAEAERLAAANEFDQAFDHYAFMLERHPDWPDLEESIQRYLYRNAGALFRLERNAESLAVLDELARRAPDHPGLAKALGDVTGRLMNGYLMDRRYGAARRLLEKTTQRGDNRLASQVDMWRSKLIQTSDEHLARANTALEAGRFREAHAQVARAIDIWPTSAGAQQTAARATSKYPIVRVGVASTQPQFASRHLDRVAFRHRKLTTRPLVELAGFGARGGVYNSHWGTWRSANDLRSVVFQLRRDAEDGTKTLTGYDVARRLWASTSNERSSKSVWRQLAAAIEVKDVYQVHVDLRSPHLSPLGLLANLHPSPEDDGSRSLGDYVRESEVDATKRFMHRQAEDVETVELRGPSEVIETRWADPHLAVAALREGRIDVIERVSPALVKSLARDNDIRVVPYAVPSIHLLAPNSARAFAANGTFRRALAFAIGREEILRQELLAGADVEGAMSISAPVPRSFASGQPWGYAYDNDISPLPREPRVGLTLARVAESDLARIAEKTGQPRPKFGEIVLGHTDDWLHVRACTAIAVDLNRIGLRCRLRLLNTGDPAELAECDFVYTEIILAEPLVDLPQWLADHPLIRPSDHLMLAIRKAVAATNWQQAGERWRQVHEVMQAEQTVIPLWQLVDHLAVRKDLAGVQEKPISLYQNIENWRYVSDKTSQE